MKNLLLSLVLLSSANAFANPQACVAKHTPNSQLIVEVLKSKIFFEKNLFAEVQKISVDDIAGENKKLITVMGMMPMLGGPAVEHKVTFEAEQTCGGEIVVK